VTAAIETSGLGKSYGSVCAVSGLDLVVEPGQVFAFLGPNGAGKTTTIRMLLALQRPTSGRASVLGLDSGRDSVEIHRRTGYLPGDLALYPRMTGASTSPGMPGPGACGIRRWPPRWPTGSAPCSTALPGSCPKATGRR
jgi:ABC-type multidrug transport system ATPase subunit